MRISTSQFYQSNTTNIIDSQSRVNQSVLNLSSGKRVVTAGDDAVAANSILNIKQEQALIGQYKSNITFADARINTEESAIAAAELVMFNVKDLVLQGNSIANDNAARLAIAEDLEARLSEMVSLANTRDESGSYVFGGFKTQNPPFEPQANGYVNYLGDEGQRLTNVGPGVQVATSDSGDKVFMSVPNSVGDFSPSYNLNPGIDNVERAILSQAKIGDRANYAPVANPDTYDVNFVTMMPSGDMGMNVTDSLGAQVYPILPALAAPYVSGDTVSFNGIDVVVKKTPQNGDSITLTPKSETNVFTVIRDAINWLKQDNGIGVDEAQRQLEIGHIIGDLDEVQINLGSVRAGIGARLQLTESQGERHEDYNLTIEKSRSALEDLDMVAAISEFEQNKLALQAAQVAYSQVQKMSLLNYL